MSEEIQNPQQKKQEQAKNKERKKQFFLTKIVALIAILFFSFLGYRYWQHKSAQGAVGKFDNVDSDIFDVPDEYKNQQNKGDDSHDLSDLSLDELKEKGVEFIYQTLIKNQLQINDLKEQIQGLKAELVKNKNQEKLGKMVFAYVDLRQKIFAGENYDEAFKNFEILAALDPDLQTKVTKLKPLLIDFSDQKKLSASFAKLIPDLIINKNNDGDGSFIGKLRKHVSKLVIIRRIDGKNPTNIDGIIAQTEQKLAEENYQEALNLLLTLDQTYHEILLDFLNKLNTSVEVKKADQEIFNYLKNLI
jgi:hypothetical protein